MLDWKKWEIKTIKKKDFPKQLGKIKNCPEKLFYRGNWDNKVFDRSIAVVGSRRMTRYGREVIHKFVPDLVANKYCLISGFMYGVDSEVHRLCLEYGGITAAVFGFGLDYLSPPENDELYSRILKNGGVVISEYEKSQKGTLWTFPQRNRIVAGLATKGILVIEAGMKSGSLITARLGHEQGKNVYAVPGPINSGTSEGTNWLIKEKTAKMATEISDLIDDMATKQMEMFETGLTGIEAKIYNLLNNEPMTIDEISKTLEINISEVSMTITNMSMKNLISEEMGKIFLNRL